MCCMYNVYMARVHVQLHVFLFQAMDRAHRLGQTKQVTVYRLIVKGSIEERILQRANEKSEIQKMVISGGDYKSDTLKPKEVVSLLLDDEEMESRCE